MKNSFTIFSFFISAGLIQQPIARAEGSDSLEVWTSKQSTHLFSSCGTTRTSDWQTKYKLATTAVYEIVTETGEEKINALDPEAYFLDYAEAIAPYHLPKTFPMRGAFFECLEPMVKFKDATSAKAQDEARTSWIACLSTESDLSAVEMRLKSCLSELKSKPHP